MQSVDIVRETKIKRTSRLMQMEGLFDVAPSDRSAERWTVSLNLPEKWNVGLIVGPSGCGKSTIARELFGDYMRDSWEWPSDASILDGFPTHMGIKDIVALLSSVGFSSPPSWVRPFHVLSNGEQFRVNMARSLAEMRELLVVDEFTSVVDRTVAKIGSSAIQKTVRNLNQKFIAVSCHYDIAEWLEPDWIYEPATNTFQSGRLLQRPKINLEIRRVDPSAWQLFRKHHYLDHDLNKAAKCFCAFWESVPVAFAAVLHFPHPSASNIKREHRMVTLPDYQGIGIGNALSAYIGSMCKGLNMQYRSITSHPAMMKSRAKSSVWNMVCSPSNRSQSWKKFSMGIRRNSGDISNRFRATFKYIGPAMNESEARLLWG